MKQDRLVHLENIIARNQCHFHEMGKALKGIRDSRLYKLNFFKTFEEYTRSRWDLGKSQTYRLINAYEVIKNLSPIGDTLPGNEFQTRPLTQLSPSDQRKIWKSFLDTAMEITEPNIKRFIASENPAKKKENIDLTNKISKEYMDTVKAMLKQVHQAQQDNWQQTSRQAGLLWNRVIRERIISKGAENGP